MTDSKVTLKDVYEVVNRLEDKMDLSTAKLEERLAKVEDAQARSKGFSAAIGAVTGAMITLVGSLIQGGVFHK